MNIKTIEVRRIELVGPVAELQAALDFVEHSGYTLIGTETTLPLEPDKFRVTAERELIEAWHTVGAAKFYSTYSGQGQPPDDYHPQRGSVLVVNGELQDDAPRDVRYSAHVG